MGCSTAYWPFGAACSAIYVFWAESSRRFNVTGRLQQTARHRLSKMCIIKLLLLNFPSQQGCTVYKTGPALSGTGEAPLHLMPSGPEIGRNPAAPVRLGRLVQPGYRALIAVAMKRAIMEWYCRRRSSDLNRHDHFFMVTLLMV